MLGNGSAKPIQHVISFWLRGKAIKAGVNMKAVFWLGIMVLT